MKPWTAAAAFTAVAGVCFASVWPHTSATGAETCAATTVRYEATRIGFPHVDLRGVRGNLFYYTGSTLMDGRVNGSDGLVTYVGGANVKLATKILWTVPRGAGRVLRLSGRRLDGEGAFGERWPRVGGRDFPSILDVPSAGCWQLSIATGKVTSTLVVLAVEPRDTPSCDPTPVYRRTPPHPQFGEITWMPATPRSEGVAALLFVTVFPNLSEAVIPSGGHFPGGPNTKFLWWAPHPGGSLKLSGTRLDGTGRFSGEFRSATTTSPPLDRTVFFPSIVDIPAAGCWAVKLRTGHSAGLVVFRVVDAG